MIETKIDTQKIKSEAKRMIAAELPAQHGNGRIINLCNEIERLRDENAKLAAFKAYVHRRLDEAGIPVDPESPHKAEGCRIGGRLDIVLRLANAMRKM